MADFNKIVEGFFHKKENLLGTQELNTLLFNEFKKKLLENKKSLKEDMEFVPPVKTKKPRTVTYNSIADIPVSELGWAGINTANVGVVDDSKRTQLEQYLKNIAGNTFDEKIKAINSFYSSSVEELIRTGIIKASTRSEKIQQMISYLVFLKTLTTIITNFNASAAGFAFEAFLAVLLGGQQIPASGATTIADILIKEGGQTVYASLKLYAESDLEVEGSFRALANDMGDKPFIRYITGLKGLSGKGLDLEGRISFYKFDFNIDNIYNILGSLQGSKDSKQCLFIAKEYISTRGQTSYEDYLRRDVDEEKISQHFTTSLEASLKNYFNSLPTIKKLSKKRFDILLNNLINFIYKYQTQNDDFFSSGGNKRSLGHSIPYKKYLKGIAVDFITSITDQKIKKAFDENAKSIIETIEGVYKDAIDYVKSESSPEAIKKSLQKINWEFDIEKCKSFYNSLSREEKIKALKNTSGFLFGRQFKLSKTQMFETTDSGKEKIGEIIVGKKNIQDLLNRISNDIDDSIFEIFDDLTVLTQNINKYFATGLRDDSAADQAQQAAVNIDKKTEEVQTQTKQNA